MPRQTKKKIKYNKYQLFFLKKNLFIKIGIYFICLFVICFGSISYFNIHHELSFLQKQLINNTNFEKEEIEIPEVEVKEVNYHVSLELTDDGYNYYVPPKGSFGYCYGPSILINDDGSLDAWFSSPGNNSTEWDWIAYSHSDDGINWSKEKIVLQPTGDSMDHYSVCDPGVIYFNGYYYLGYTSTIVSTNEGINNNIFVARSKNPDGPYEKWNGNGWGGKPKPIIYYDESDSYWGTGEISFVVVDDTLYCYYSWYCEHGFYTKVSTASLSENWPSTLEYKGIIYDNRGAQDSGDVVYLDDYDKFVSFSIVNRMNDCSGVMVFESDDGIHFKEGESVYTNLCMYAHNMGISKHLNGHINMEDNLKIGYAYANSYNSKGKWPLRMQSINLLIYDNETGIEHDKGNPTYTNYSITSEKSYNSGLVPSKRTIYLKENEKATVSFNLFSQNRVRSSINKGIKYDYDDSIISISGNTIKALKEGNTVVTAYYDDFYTTFSVNIRNSNAKEIAKFEPVEETIELHIENKNYHTKQIRGYVEFENGLWGESYNDYTLDHPKYPATIDGNKYKMTYEVEDENICYVDDEGIIYPKRVGKTKIKVTINNDRYFYVNVIVEF